ncbi:MAG: hypothetical protein AAGC60_09795 [Acidobacteriota bacterium]
MVRFLRDGVSTSTRRALTLAAWLAAGWLGLGTCSAASTGVVWHPSSGTYQVHELGTGQATLDQTLDLSDQLLFVRAADLRGGTWRVIDDPPITAPPFLLQIDAATGARLDEIQLTLPVDGDVPRDLETGPDGTLWMLSSRSGLAPTVIGQLDPTTGQVAEIATSESRVGGLTFVGDEAWTVIPSNNFDTDAMLARLDLATGALEEIGTLPDTPCFEAGDLDFDDGGAVHIALSPTACVTIPPVEMSLRSYRLAAAGEPLTQIAQFRPVLAGNVAALHVRGGVTPVDVPMLGVGGLIALAALFVLGGMLLLGRARAGG